MLMKTYETEKPKVLLVDNDVKNLILIKEMLEHMDFEFFVAQDGKEALQRVSENDFDMILLEVVIPTIDGYEVCRQIKANEDKRDTSIIFLSTLQSREDKIKGFTSGADDYLIKPLYQPEVIARVKLHLEKRIMLKRLKQLLRHSFHELYNPLAIIETSAQMYDAYNEPNKYVNAMHAGAKSLHVIYEDLYYALSSHKTEDIDKPINVAPLIQDRIDFFTLLADVKGISFEVELADEIYILVPLVDIQRVIDNTISNAVKYAFENTTISIVLSNINDTLLSVSNQGINIKDTEQIFTKGYREAYEHSGMGIGLEIVSSICHHYNIGTFVKSQNNITTFTYKFSKE